jgi:metallo-beta-lactamase class B
LHSKKFITSLAIDTMPRMFQILMLLASSMPLFAQGDHSLKITHLTGDFYIYTTYNSYNGTKFPANGMYVVGRDGVILVDTPWDSTQFQPLLDSIQKRHHRKVVVCIATHFHADRTAGLEYYHQQGIATYTSVLTHQLSRTRGEKLAANHFAKDTVFRVGEYSFQAFYPGKGHSPDNIVIWFDQQKVLYGGCFVKSVDNGDIGNIADADVTSWAPAVEKVIGRFKNPAFIIPGHFAWHSTQALDHTLKLIKKHQHGKR